MYSRDGHMMVLMTRSDRPKPDSIKKITDGQRQSLFSSMLAYAGTYKFDGTSIEHFIDLSWNEVWNGTMQVRDIKKDGDRLNIHHTARTLSNRRHHGVRDLDLGKSNDLEVANWNDAARPRRRGD